MKMPFGKHKGIELTNLPEYYLMWLSRIELWDPLKTAVQQECARRGNPQSEQKTSTSIPSDVKIMAEEIITAGYRKLAIRHHPDHGGETKAMILVNLAMEVLRKFLDPPFIPIIASSETTKKKKETVTIICPYGGTFGKDCDELDACRTCDIWEKCADLSFAC